MARPVLRLFYREVDMLGAGGLAYFYLSAVHCGCKSISLPSALSVQGTRRQSLAAQRTPAPRQVQATLRLT